MPFSFQPPRQNPYFHCKNIFSSFNKQGNICSETYWIPTNIATSWECIWALLNLQIIPSLYVCLAFLSIIYSIFTKKLVFYREWRQITSSLFRNIDAIDKRLQTFWLPKKWLLHFSYMATKQLKSWLFDFIIDIYQCNSFSRLLPI